MNLKEKANYLTREFSDILTSPSFWPYPFSNRNLSLLVADLAVFQGQTIHGAVCS